MTPEDDAIRTCILALLSQRRADASICPSDVARSLAPEDEAQWRALMPHVRRVAAKLSRQQRLRVTRGTAELAAGETAGGPIRLRRGERF